ncbi:MAG: N-acyl-D-amino-acid deacylase family protein [Burkholderiaceae bacterium]
MPIDRPHSPVRTVWRGGTVVDGTGATPYRADVEVIGARITAVGAVPAGQGVDIDISGKILTPGFIDVHTHYDGQVTWAERLLPSSAHGVTTAVIGNCGVGFAPCRAADRDTLVHLMEGVEDIPEIVFTQGLPWTWESFSQYLDFLAARQFDMDVCAYVPHAALRVYAMGERGARRESASGTDRQAMRALVCEAMRAGAMGFSTSRTIHHRSSDGSNAPMYQASTEELVELALGLSDAGAGLLQVVAGFTEPERDFAVLRAMALASGRPLTVSLAQNHERPDDWRAIMAMLEASAADGLDISAQVCGRSVGMLLGLDMSLHPFTFHPGYQDIAALPLRERVARLRQPELRARILAEQPRAEGAANQRALARVLDLDGIYELRTPPDYEPRERDSIAARARERGVAPAELAYELMLRDEGGFTFMRPLHNYAHRDLQVCREMLVHPLTYLGLGDGGAHCGYICDASLPTFMLTHWTRDRGHGLLPLETVVRKLTVDGARLMGLADRGRIAPGLKADINVIDYALLQLEAPRVAYDLPGGGRRLLQDARGYAATMVSGTVTQRDGVATGALPGALVRGPAYRAGGDSE